MIKQYQQLGFTHENRLHYFETTDYLYLKPQLRHLSYLYCYAKVTSILPRTSKCRTLSKPLAKIKKSSKLEHDADQISWTVLRKRPFPDGEAGHKIIKLNIGNPAPFGFRSAAGNYQRCGFKPAECDWLYRFQRDFPGA